MKKLIGKINSTISLMGLSLIGTLGFYGCNHPKDLGLNVKEVKSLKNHKGIKEYVIWQRAQDFDGDGIADPFFVFNDGTIYTRLSKWNSSNSERYYELTQEFIARNSKIERRKSDTENSFRYFLKKLENYDNP